MSGMKGLLVNKLRISILTLSFDSIKRINASIAYTS